MGDDLFSTNLCRPFYKKKKQKKNWQRELKSLNCVQSLLMLYGSF